MSNKPLPIAGYTSQSDSAVTILNRNKQAEERVLRLLDELEGTRGIDPRWVAIGRTHIEQGFMAINRAVFRPTRIRLPEDEQVIG